MDVYKPNSVPGNLAMTIYLGRISRHASSGTSLIAFRNGDKGHGLAHR